MSVTPFFLPTDGGQRFCLLHTSRRAPLAPLASILYVHPFAEELNRSRRMVALQCRALAAAGFEVLQIDLGGCGDSAGHFADATWQGWVADVLAARDWLVARRQQGQTCPADSPLTTDANDGIWLWGLRAGCLLAAEVARQLPRQLLPNLADSPGRPVNLLFWQPVNQGAQHLAQFLRLKVATELVRGVSAGVTAPAAGSLPNASPKPRQLLADGQSVEIGGYELSPVLAAGLEAAHLDGLPEGSRVLCVEFVAAVATDGADAAVGTVATAVSPALASQMGKWLLQGVQAESQAVPGAPFWQTLEVEVAMQAIDHTVKQLVAVQEQDDQLRQARR